MARHLIAPFVRIRSVFLVAAFAGLAACGGGDGGGATPSSVTYTGKTTPAEITAANASSLTLSAYDSGTFASGASPLGVQVQTDSETGTADALSVVRIAQKVVQKAKSPTSVSATGTLVEVAVVPGDCGGTAVVSADDAGAPILSLAFNSFCDVASGITLQGQMTMTFTGSEAAPTAINFSMSLLIRENATGVVYRLDNYNIVVADITYDSYGNVASQTVSYSGRFYSPSEGYVALSTPTPFYYSATSSFPTAGVLVVTEVGPSPAAKARLTAQADGVHYTIEVDLNGDNTYSDTGSGDPAMITDTWV